MADGGDEARSHLPLQGVVLCSTSLLQDVRTELAKYAIEMGATHTLDLTGEVTHLLVGDIKTPKYRYVAKSRPDVKVLHPDWICDVRKHWLEGEDVQISMFEEKHKLPVFSGLSLCVTGFELQVRAKFEAAFKHHGANYCGDLTKQVSHLIVAKPEGAKYTHAKQWGIPCVTLHWLNQSIKRGMTLEEIHFDPLIPEDEQGVGSLDFKKQNTAKMNKRAREEDQPVNSGKRKLRRTASSRLENHSQDLWQDMAARDDAGKQMTMDSWNETANSNPSRPVSAASTNQQTNVVNKTSRLFSECRMHLAGFDPAREAKLKHVLHEQCGADIISSVTDLSRNTHRCFIVIPHVPPKNIEHLRETDQAIVTTEWWVERCIHNKRVLEADQDPLSRPFWSVNIEGIKGLTITSTGLSSLDLRQTAAIINATGAVYQEQLTPTTKVLISGSDKVKKEKAYYAAKHGIPVVSMDWLWQSLSLCRAQPFNTFQYKNDVDLPKTRQEPSTIKSAMKPPATTSPNSMSARSHLQHSSKKFSPSKSGSKVGPFLVEEDSPSNRSEKKSPLKALKERSPNVTSPSRRRLQKPEPLQFVSSDELSRIERQNNEVASLKKDLNQLSRQLSLGRCESLDTAQLRRKKRTLGRASSAISHRSMSASIGTPLDESFNPWDASADRESRSDSPAPMPSTQLGYEMPEAEAHRLQMAKKLGTSFASDVVGTKLQSLGKVKDTDGRVTRRRTAR